MLGSTVREPVRARREFGFSDRSTHARWDLQETASVGSSFEAHRLDVRTSRISDIEWLRPIIDRFNEFLRLPENWDSYGASRIGLQPVAAAMELLAQVMTPKTPRPSVVPTTEGGVQLEWHIRGVDLEVEIDPSGRPYANFVDEGDDTEWEADLTDNVRPLLQALSVLRYRR